jgi:hypothetical protein
VPKPVFKDRAHEPGGVTVGGVYYTAVQVQVCRNVARDYLTMGAPVPPMYGRIIEAADRMRGA